MPTPTYTPLATVTLASAAASVTFSSIPATYRDLILVVANLSATAANTLYARLNGDTGSNYSFVIATGSSGGAQSVSSASNSNGLFMGAAQQGLPITSPSQAILQIMDYSATDKHKTALGRYGSTGQSEVDMSATRWANTAAVTSLLVRIAPSGSFNSGVSLSLYGVIS
jgi:hypothetical protein